MIIVKTYQGNNKNNPTQRRLTYFDQLFKMKDPSLTACSPHMV
jgi:hypothetical protein